ncbi:hypothetical protein TNCV_2926241 [Trichonephila clavipes]|nr:hypothetical protein TNCV_2926241 [Trichonephila clavipes]
MFVFYTQCDCPYHLARYGARITSNANSPIAFSKYRYVHHEAARRFGTHLKRQHCDTSVFGFVVALTIVVVCQWTIRSFSKRCHTVRVDSYDAHTPTF